MLLVRGILILGLVAAIACASHAQRAAKAATKGVKAQVAELDPAIARTLGDQHARGAVNGALAELANEQHRELLGAIAAETSEAAARGMMAALPDSARLQQLIDRIVAGAVGDLGRHLAADTALQGQLAAITHQLSASAVYGARDALGDIFPECTGALDRRRCVEDKVGELSRAAARGMMSGFLSAGKWPLLAFAFLAGALVTLLLVRARSTIGHRGAAAPKQAT
jgi:hypothetical protein